MGRRTKVMRLLYSAECCRCSVVWCGVVREKGGSVVTVNP